MRVGGAEEGKEEWSLAGSDVLVVYEDGEDEEEGEEVDEGEGVCHSVQESSHKPVFIVAGRTWMVVRVWRAG